ncbi:ABC transporter permease subunit [Ruminococcaceae bacterium OttesenSCG-928-L11]|nr:ABC transporter permease subunit [Ruminococcaceae bacterium OttesenSCG-928-L11]
MAGAVKAKESATKATGRAKKKDGFVAEFRRNKVMFAMLIPVTVYFLLNNYLPMAGIYLAFTKFNFVGGIFGSPFVGMENFKFLFSSGKLLKLTANTLSYNVMFILVDHVLQITFAIILSRLGSRIFTKFTQSVMFLPHFVSFVILNVIVYNIFNYEVGFLNGILTSLGQQPFDAYNTPGAWRFILLALHVWKGVGYGTVVYLATITGISTELYEAADIDGANVFQQIRYITLPLLVPTFIILLLMSLGRIMRGQFDLFYQTVGNVGTLYDVTDILDTFVYRSLRLEFDVGMGTAAGLYQSVFGFIVIMSANAAIKKYQKDYALF